MPYLTHLPPPIYAISIENSLEGQWSTLYLLFFRLLKKETTSYKTHARINPLAYSRTLKTSTTPVEALSHDWVRTPKHLRRCPSLHRWSPLSWTGEGPLSWLLLQLPVSLILWVCYLNPPNIQEANGDNCSPTHLGIWEWGRKLLNSLDGVKPINIHFLGFQLKMEQLNSILSYKVVLCISHFVLLKASWGLERVILISWVYARTRRLCTNNNGETFPDPSAKVCEAFTVFQRNSISFRSSSQGSSSLLVVDSTAVLKWWEKYKWPLGPDV